MSPGALLSWSRWSRWLPWPSQGGGGGSENCRWLPRAPDAMTASSVPSRHVRTSYQRALLDCGTSFVARNQVLCPLGTSPQSVGRSAFTAGRRAYRRVHAVCYPADRLTVTTTRLPSCEAVQRLRSTQRSSGRAPAVAIAQGYRTGLEDAGRTMIDRKVPPSNAGSRSTSA